MLMILEVFSHVKFGEEIISLYIFPKIHSFKDALGQKNYIYIYLYVQYIINIYTYL